MTFLPGRRARSHLCAAIAIAVMLATSGPAAAADGDGDRLVAARQAAAFAFDLFAEGDYYRSIGELKRAIFLAPDAPERARWSLKIGEAYREGEQAEPAARHFDRVAQELPVVRSEALLGAAKSYLAAGYNETAAVRADQASDAFVDRPERRREARFVEGWALLGLGRDEEAGRAFAAARGEGPIGEGAARLVDLMPRLAHLPRRSPALAGVLGIVPGLGHLYVGQPGEALSALVWNGIFGWALYDAIREKNYGLAAALGLFEAMWYGGSIVGAVSGAHRFNRDARLNALDDLSDVAPRTLPDDVRTLVR